MFEQYYFFLWFLVYIVLGYRRILNVKCGGTWNNVVTLYFQAELMVC